MELHDIYLLAIAVGLGFMVGLQRETRLSPIAGVRTYPLITVSGLLMGILSRYLGPWPIVAGILAVVALMVMGNVAMVEEGNPEPGMTSEFASVVMYGVGVLLALQFVSLAVVTAGTVLVLLQAKEPLRHLSEKLGEADLNALAQLVLLGLVILPAMPDRAMGPMGILNPHEIWLMVVLIVGISLAAYVAYKFVGGKAGTLVVGVLGGLISSTASTITFSRLTVHKPQRVPGAAVMIVISSTVVFARVLVELFLVARPVFLDLAPPVFALMMGMIGICLILYRWAGTGLAAPMPEEPPSDLRSAVLFGLLYAAVLLGVAVARTYWGDQGLYAVAFLSGLTDMDAITLSSGNLVREGQLEAGLGWRMILTGGISNLIFKGGIVVALAGKGLRRPVLLAFGGAVVMGLLIIFLWP